MREMRRSMPILAALVMGSVWTDARAAYVSVDLSGATNENFRASPYQTVASLPVGGTSIIVGTTPFALSTLNGLAGTTGVVQTGPFDPSVTAPNSVAIAVNIAGATEVDTLINSTFGSLNQPSGRVQFFGTGGAFASFDLVQGVNIRDYNVGSVFNNAIAAGTNTVTYTSGTSTAATRLDEQTFLLPASFAGQTLTSIVLVDSSTFVLNGEPFLAAATAVVSPSAAVPEPSSLALCGFASLGLGAVRTRRRAAVA